jgi:hypothetical protein
MKRVTWVFGGGTRSSDAYELLRASMQHLARHLADLDDELRVQAAEAITSEGQLRATRNGAAYGADGGQAELVHEDSLPVDEASAVADALALDVDKDVVRGKWRE